MLIVYIKPNLALLLLTTACPAACEFCSFDHVTSSSYCTYCMSGYYGVYVEYDYDTGSGSGSDYGADFPNIEESVSCLGEYI